MHGRLKVRTTEEQAEIKKKAQEEKLKQYTAITSKINEKRSLKENNKEARELCAQILLKNPEFHSLWNYRKEILTSLKNEKTEEEIKQLCLDELELTQECLKVNPKSYGTWNHRLWVNEFNPAADWNRELKLCNYFHSKDERNFHCWDYRRHVCKKCNTSPKDELAYTTELIESNFSNYSAWHYRSKLLPIVHPGPTKGSLEESVLLKELNLIQNAAFTDPDDQSVWFYHRWLLGRTKMSLDILNVTVFKEERYIVVLFSEPLKFDDTFLTIEVNNVPVSVNWSSIGQSRYTSPLWKCVILSSFAEFNIERFSIRLQKGQNDLSLTCDLKSLSSWKMNSRSNFYRSELSAATKDVLQMELESCQQLMEFESDCKWTLFTCVLLMRAIDNVKYQNEIKKCMNKLVEVDALRKNYYKDLASKFIVEDYLEQLPLSATEVNLSNQSLTTLCHFDQLFLVQKLDLSSNCLTSVRPLQHLLCLRHLVLDDNRLSDLEGTEELEALETLSVARNLLQETSVMRPLKNLKKLRELKTDGNPLVVTMETLEKL